MIRRGPLRALCLLAASCVGALPVVAEGPPNLPFEVGMDSLGAITSPELIGPRQAMEEGDYAAAIAELKEVVRTDTAHVQALRMLASAYGRLDAGVQAIEVCRRISTMDSTDSGVEVALGYFHHRQGDFDTAQYHYRRGLVRDPNAVQAYQGLGWIHLQRRQLEQALDMVTRTTEHAPDYAPNYLLMGRVLTAQGFFADAATAYRRAFALRPSLRERYGILLQELTLRHNVIR